MYRITKAALCCAVCISLLLGVGASAHAAYLDWTGAAPGGWHNAVNWTITSGTDSDNLVDGDDYATVNSGSASITSPANCYVLLAGDGSGTAGSISLHSGGSLNAWTESIGNSQGNAEFIHNGGTNTTDGLELGKQSGAVGTYRMYGGLLDAGYVRLGGTDSTGRFFHDNGDVDATSLTLGEANGGQGTYAMTGGTLDVIEQISIGKKGQPSGFSQTNGAVTTGRLFVGGDAIGSYELSGPGSLDVSGWNSPGMGCILQVGGETGISSDFVQSGGTVTVVNQAPLNFTGELRLGDQAGSRGTYTLSAGSLSVERLIVGYNIGDGEFHITAPAPTTYVKVSDSMIISSRGLYTAVAGAVIHFSSDFINQSFNPLAAAGLANTEMIFEGGTDMSTFEVAGEDLGDVMPGLVDNFALDTLTLGGLDVGYLQLGDLHDNQPGWTGDEALYVRTLNVGAGSYLDLNGLNLYYLYGSLDPTAIVDLNGGTLVLIPEPVSLILLTPGTVLILKRRRRRA